METIQVYKTPVHENSENVTLDCYLTRRHPGMDERPSPAILIMPGGGYGYCSQREGGPIANMFVAKGYSAFVLWYSCAPNCGKVNPLLDAAAAIALLRNEAQRFGIDPQKIAVCGFSAGGHLAGWLSNAYNSPVIREKLMLGSGVARPDATILCYPVVSGVSHPNKLSFSNLLGCDSPSFEELSAVSLEKLVTENTPPAFVWHTAADTLVPVQNSLMYCNALAENGVPFELHVFPSGFHGLSLADRLTCENGYAPYVARWTELCAKWCDNIFYDGDFLKN